MKYTIYFLIFSILWNTALPASSDEAAWKFEWDRQLPSLRLNNVSIDAPGLVRAWQDLNSAYMIRSVLVDFYDKDTNIPFAFACESCTVAEVLDALCQSFDYQWAADKSTGVIWLEPAGWNRDDLQRNRVEVPITLRGLPMHTGVLEGYFSSLESIQIISTWTEQWLNEFDFPVTIEAGSYTTYDIINRCLVWAPSITFYIHRNIHSRYEIHDLHIPRSRMGPSIKEGARLFWSIENGKPTQAPTIAELANWLGNDSPRKRWAAQRYLGMTVWAGNLEGMLNHLSRGSQTETKLRALFSFLQWWLPKGILYNMPTELDRVVNNALESEKFADYSPDTQLRLVSLGLARTNDPQRQEALLRKIQRSSAAALAEMDFDVRAFMNNHPAIEEKLKR